MRMAERAIYNSIDVFPQLDILVVATCGALIGDS
jgi:hypothetical protein